MANQPFAENDRVVFRHGYYAGKRGTVRGLSREGAVRVQIDGTDRCWLYPVEWLRNLSTAMPARPSRLKKGQDQR